MATYGLPKNQKVLAAIGTITLRHGQLDNAIRRLIQTLADVTKKQALDATAMQTSRELRDRTRRLAKQKLGEGPALVQLDALLARARVATEERNEIVHSFWGIQEDEAVIRDRHHTYQSAPSLTKLNTLASDLADIRSEITEARLHGFICKALKKRSAANPPQD